MQARLSRNFENSSDTIDVELSVPLNVGDTIFSCIEDSSGVSEYEGTVTKVHHFIDYKGYRVTDHTPMYTLEMRLIREMI